MRSSLTTNIMLIILLVFSVGSFIYGLKLTSDIADEASTSGVKEFTGNTRKLARKLAGKN